MSRADRSEAAHRRATGELATWLCRVEVEPGIECAAAGTVPAGQQAAAQHAHYLAQHYAPPPSSRRPPVPMNGA